MEYRENIKKIFIKRNGYVPTEEELDKFISSGDYLENNATYSKGEIWTSRLLIIWFITSIVSLFMFSYMEKAAELVLVFVHYFLVFGIIILFSKKKDANLTWLFVAGLIFLAFLWLDPNGIKINMNADMMMFAGLGLVFFVAGIVFLITGLNNIRKNKTYIGVNAIVCGHRRHGKSKACVYEYEIDGKKYKITDNFYTNVGVPEIGSIKNIKVNPNNYEEILTKSGTIFFILFSIPFIFMGGLFLIVGLVFICK